MCRAIGRIQLKNLDEWNNKRRLIANTYDQGLKDIKEIIIPPKAEKNIEPVYHMYVIRTYFRDELGAWLRT